MTFLLAIGTRKGLFVARSDDRVTWDLEGPHLSLIHISEPTRPY